MKNTTKKILIITILMVFALGFAIFTAVAQPKDPSATNFIIYVRQGNQKILSGYQNSYVSLEDLGNLFGVPIQSQEGGRSAKVGHLYYNDAVVSYRGKAYTRGSNFFNFFGMPHTLANQSTISTTALSIPIFDQTLWRTQQCEMIVAGIKSSEKVLIVNGNQRYIPLDLITSRLHLPESKLPNGMLMVNSRRINRWLPYDGKTYVHWKDIEVVTGKPVM